MIDKEIGLFLELWDTLKVYIPVKEKLDAAQHVLTTIDEHGIDLIEHEDELMGHCSVLDSAIKTHKSQYEELDEDME